MTIPDRVICISDLHLTAERPEIFQAFRVFTEDIAGSAKALYILGDFFDVWIGDDDDSTFPRKVCKILNSLSASGTDVFLMHGNRDFLLGRAFTDACQATLLEEPYLLECHGKRYLLMHGDSLCTRDEEYMAFRSMVRDPEWQNEFLSKPLQARRAFAQRARAQSKSMSSNKPEDIMDVTPEEVTRVLRRYDLTTLVHGHTHRPAIHDIRLPTLTGTRIVLGDWDKRGWFLEITPELYRLTDFPIQA